MPALRSSADRNDADGCLYLLSRLYGLRRDATAKTRRLLRLLFLWVSGLSPNAVRATVLRYPEHAVNCEDANCKSGMVQRDWARGARGLLIWCVPLAILLISPLLYETSLVVIWPSLLTFMGIACLMNARRCGRLHCYLTGPFFLLLAPVALLYGLGVVPLGRNGWGFLSTTLIIGGALLTCGPEWFFGRYRSSSR